MKLRREINVAIQEARFSFAKTKEPCKVTMGQRQEGKKEWREEGGKKKRRIFRLFV